MNRFTFYQYWIAVLIAYFEGFFSEGSRARRNNNPGNLRGWSKKNRKDPDGFDIFQDLATGWNALLKQVEKNIFRDLTVREFFEGKPGVYPGYAPLSDGNPPTYARFVADALQIPVDNISILALIRGVQPNQTA